MAVGVGDAVGMEIRMVMLVMMFVMIVVVHNAHLLRFFLLYTIFYNLQAP